jgi:hypothetical protein
VKGFDRSSASAEAWNPILNIAICIVETCVFQSYRIDSATVASVTICSVKSERPTPTVEASTQRRSTSLHKSPGQPRVTDLKASLRELDQIHVTTIDRT